LSQRKDVPLWAQELTVWVNSHWQNNDIFDKSGGAPAVVEERVLDIVERFGLGNGTLGLHWYEWDTLGYVSGSNYSNCGSEITCGFDTHYPEYFPVRQNFQASLERMQQVGVRVTPYINGRIFDQATESWTDHSHEAKHAACKSTPASLLPDKKNIPLQLYNETYGSKAEFAVMCPHTQYWQHTLAGVVGELAHTYNTDGVYIDQIAAAGPRPCWDPSHNHSLGGGHHWQSGYAALLGSVRKNAGNSKLLLTESNAEPFMSGIDMFLTLVGFSVGDLSPPAPGAAEQATYIVPAFQSVYGGYYLSMGAEFFPTDFVPNPDVFAAKLANQFLFGAQMGWFSLGGKDGIYNDLMDSAYDREVAYLRLLSKAKQTANKWLVHGRAMRRVAFVVNGTATNKPSRRQHVQVPNFRLSRAHYGTDKDRTDAGVSFDSVMSSSWYSKAMDGGSLLVLITTCERHSPATLMASMDMRRFGFDGDSVASEMFDVFDVPPDGLSPPKKVGTFKGAEVQLSVKMGARAVVLLRVTKSKRQY
jgi:hypothetical protein